MTKWHAEQLPYPRDADYHGAKSGIFDPDEDAEKIVGNLNAGYTFIYLFRRFGYPRFGWDGFKKLIQYHLTTPMPGVLLTVEPDVTRGGTFGYMLREDIDQACEEEARKPWQDRYKRFEVWAIETKGIETMHIYYEPDHNKLQRVFKRWAMDKDDSDFEDDNEIRNAFYEDQAKITNDLLDEYMKIEPHPEQIPLEDRPDDSIMKQCHNALCDAIRDLLRPVYVRDVLLDITGKLSWTESVEPVNSDVEYTPSSGYGIGDKLDNVKSDGGCK